MPSTREPDSQSNGERCLAAVVFCDLVGYTASVQENEAEALGQLASYRERVREAVRNGRGREVKTIGDGFLLEFRSALEAVQAALAIQESLAQSPPLKARIGIHIADVQRDGDDILGDGVNIASRIEPLAAGGGICVSEDVARQVRNKCPASLVRLGRGELRNVKLPVQVYRVLVHRRDVRVRELLGWAVGRHLRRAWPLASAIAIFLLVLFVRWVATIEPVTEDRLLERSTLLPSSYIAVLDLEYADEVCRAYAANLTDEIRAYLARKSAFEGLVIVDTEGFSRESKSVREIGAQLRAGSVLYGRVWAENGSWIVDLTLTASTRGVVRWKDEFKRPIADGKRLHLASVIADAIARVIGPVHTPVPTPLSTEITLSRLQ